MIPKTEIPELLLKGTDRPFSFAVDDTAYKMTLTEHSIVDLRLHSKLFENMAPELCAELAKPGARTAKIIIGIIERSYNTVHTIAHVDKDAKPSTTFNSAQLHKLRSSSQRDVLQAALPIFYPERPSVTIDDIPKVEYLDLLLLTFMPGLFDKFAHKKVSNLLENRLPVARDVVEGTNLNPCSIYAIWEDSH
jgi:hypothetical protein